MVPLAVTGFDSDTGSVVPVPLVGAGCDLISVVESCTLHYVSALFLAIEISGDEGTMDNIPSVAGFLGGSTVGRGWQLRLLLLEYGGSLRRRSRH